MAWFPHESIDAVTYCILCSRVKQAWEHWIQKAIAQQNGTKDAFTESSERSEMEAEFEKTLDPHSWQSSYKKISEARIIDLFADDFLEQVETICNNVF